MRISTLLSFVGTGCAALVSLAACGTTNNNSYYTSGPDGGPAIVLSSAGESCARQADCASGLQCIRNVCSTGTTTTPDGGTTPPASPQLSQLGQNCAQTEDCGQGLVCVPIPGVLHTGICDLASFGLTPTGKTCSGECNTATDCCELPTGLTIGAATPTTCEDIVKNVLNNNVTQCTAATPPTGTIAKGCFYYAAYCAAGGCGANTWSCTSNQCVYKASCTSNNDLLVGGCAIESRAGRTLPGTCNASSCQAAATGCMQDSDCATVTAATNSATHASCTSGDCTCQAGSCYVKCASDLDCEGGYVCDTTKHVCTVAPQCSTNSDCVGKGVGGQQNVNAICSSGTCITPCSQDHDCSPSSGAAAVQGSLGPFLGQVCDTKQKQCVAVGCSSDANCETGAAGPVTPVHMFCDTASTAAAPKYASAVTDTQ